MGGIYKSPLCMECVSEFSEIIKRIHNIIEKTLLYTYIPYYINKGEC